MHGVKIRVFAIAQHPPIVSIMTLQDSLAYYRNQHRKCGYANVNWSFVMLILLTCVW